MDFLIENFNSPINIKALPEISINSLKVASIALIAGICIGCSSMPDTDVITTSISAEPANPAAYSVQKKASKAAKRTRKPVTLASSSPLGRAPYICTPSGFGRKAQCYAR